MNTVLAEKGECVHVLALRQSSLLRTALLSVCSTVPKLVIFMRLAISLFAPLFLQQLSTSFP